VTNLSARTVVLIMATGSAKTDLVALAQTVARNHGLGAIDQCIAVIISGTVTLSYVIYNATAGTLSARLATLAWI